MAAAGQGRGAESGGRQPPSTTALSRGVEAGYKSKLRNPREVLTRRGPLRLSRNPVRRGGAPARHPRVGSGPTVGKRRLQATSPSPDRAGDTQGAESTTHTRDEPPLFSQWPVLA